MRYIDTFCGVGGFSIAIKNVIPDAECVMAIDNDKNCAKTFYENFGIDCLGDMTQIDFNSIPNHDILFGGFPCQPFSRNGKWYNHNNRTIDNDERANLFLRLINILNAKKPKYFVFENVEGLLSIKNKDGTLYYNTIMSMLEQSNYQVYNQILDAADYGLPQQRKRIFFVGIRNDINQTFIFPEKIKRSTCVNDIKELSVDDKYLLKNKWKNRKILNGTILENKTDSSPNHSIQKGDERLKALKEIYYNKEHSTKKTFKISPVAIIYGDTPSGRARQSDKLYNKYGISPAILTFTTPSFDFNDGWRQLTPRECARLQGFSDSFVLPKSDTSAYKQMGNSINIPTVVRLLKSLL